MSAPRRPARWAAALLSCLLCLVPAATAWAQSATSASGTAATAPAAAPTSPGSAQFTDIAGNWAQGDIDQLLGAGVLTVPSDGLFHPGQPISRLSFAVWMARALELPASTVPLKFTDAAQIPQADRGAVAAAVAAGIIEGRPGPVFAPNDPITRAEMATIFGRALEAKGQQPQARFFDLFPDGATVPSWALPAALVVQDQIMYGEPCSPSPCFDPSAATTRAQAAALIVRFLQYMTTKYHSAPLPQATGTAPFVLGMWYSDTSEGYANLVAHGGDINQLIYGGYDIQPGGTMIGFDSPRTLAWASGHPDVPLWVMVQASSLSFLGNPGQTQQLLSNVVQIVKRAGYAGVNFDIEGIPGADRNLYTAFITQAAADLHGIGAKISVAVPSEQANDLGQWWDQAYNYPALGAVVDQLIMMAYDYHTAGSSPGPISPISWDQAVVSYAKSVMPPSKVFLGTPAYGYIWNARTDGATAYWVDGMQNMAAQHGATITRNQAAQEATFTYQAGGNTYVGWFVDAQGVAARIALAHRMGIGGVIAWRMDYGTSSWWPVWAQDIANWR